LIAYVRIDILSASAGNPFPLKWEVHIMSLNRSSLLLLVAVSLPLTPVIASAQSTDRSKLVNQIEELRNQIKQKEGQLLAVSDQDKAAYSEFLSQPDTGICRLMPREDFDGKLLVRGGGAYYSFTKKSSSYDSYPQIGLERNEFLTSFAGADYGYITDLGDVPIEALTAEYPAVRDLAAFTTPNAEPDARIEQRKSGQGLSVGNHVYKRGAGAAVGHSYVLRSVIYDNSDTLVAVRVVKQDDDGSLILLWRILNRFPSPQLLRGDTR